MSVSGVGSNTNLPSTSPPPVASAISTAARASDGDYKARNSHTSQVKDSDGDYRPITAQSSPASVSSSAVLTALTSLTKGG